MQINISHLCRMRFWSEILLVIVCLTLSPHVASAQDQAKPNVPTGVSYEPNVEYGKGGDVSLKLDLARPEKMTKPAPCILVIHGGGWRAGNKSGHTPEILELAKQGYVAVSVAYRFCPEHRFPSQVEDVKCAVRFLRANAEKYQIDPQHLGAVGFSAGAHLSMMLGVMDKEDGLEGEGGNPTQSSKVQAVVAYFGPTEMGADDIPALSKGLVADFLGFSKEDNKEVYKRASPITYVTKGDAPTLIFQGTKDRLVPATQATKMADALSAAGVPGRVELLVGADHGWGGDELQRTREESLRFFNQQLRGK